MPEDKVNPAGSGPMRARSWHPVAVFGPPLHGFRVLSIEIEHVDAGYLASGDTDLRPGMVLPQLAESNGIAYRILERGVRNNPLRSRPVPDAQHAQARPQACRCASQGNLPLD
jgi:hypothetical protein